MRLTNTADKYISYRLNILGIRVWEDRCHLVAKDRAGNGCLWESEGELPIHLPDYPGEIDGDTLLLTAYQYDLEQPRSDLRAVLLGARLFAEALQDGLRMDTCQRP